MRICILAAAAALASGGASAQGPGKPVIDMHLHAFPVEFAAGAPGCPGDQEVLLLPLDPQEEFDYSILGTCADPFFASESDEALLRETIEALERYNVRHAVTSGALKEVSAWRAAALERIILALNFAGETRRKAKEFRRLYEEDAFQVFAEITAQYRGVPPTIRSGSLITPSPRSSTSRSAFISARDRPPLRGFRGTRPIASP